MRTMRRKSSRFCHMDGAIGPGGHTPRPHASLDAALAEIERHTRGALDVESVLDGGVGGENLSARSRVQR